MMCYLKVLSCREQRFRDISTNFSVDYNHHSYPYWTLKSTLFPISRIVNPYTWISVVKLRQGSGKDRQGMAVKAIGLKA